MRIAMLTTIAALGLAMAVPTASFAADAAAGARTGKVANQSARFTHFNAPGSASYCYTCGGDWPVFGGFMRPDATYNTTRVYELGSACSGSYHYATDSAPYLCTR